MDKRLFISLAPLDFIQPQLFILFCLKSFPAAIVKFPQEH